MKLAPLPNGTGGAGYGEAGEGWDCARRVQEPELAAVREDIKALVVVVEVQSAPWRANHEIQP